MRYRLSAALLASLIVLAGCDATTPPDEVDRPEVIAPAAFDFDGDLPDALAAGENYNNAAFRVGVVTGIIGLNLVLPSAATHAATRATPYVEDGTWIWESTFEINRDDVTFRLEGTPRGREVSWRMGITNSELDDFTLYTGRTDFDGRTGDWQLFYEIEGARTEVLRADFEIESEMEAEITYSVPPGRDAAGSSVLYANDTGVITFDWDQQPENLRHLIQWDERTGAGWIEADNYNGGERACWGPDLEDAPCVPALAAK